jgi:hypothetical protein
MDSESGLPRTTLHSRPLPHDIAQAKARRDRTQQRVPSFNVLATSYLRTIPVRR